MKDQFEPSFPVPHGFQSAGIMHRGFFAAMIMAGYRSIPDHLETPADYLARAAALIAALAD